MYIEFYVIEKISLKFIRIMVYSVLSIIGLIWFQLWDMPFLYYNSCRGYLFFFAGVLLFNATEHLGKNGNLKFSGILIFAKNIRQFLSRFGRLLGASSFCVNLLHIPVFILAKLVFDIDGIEIRHSYLSMVLMLVIVEAIGAMVYLYYEVPIGNLCKKVETHSCLISK